MFDLETGLILPGSISSDSLKDLSPDPSGTGQRVRVSKKGQVTEIVSETNPIAPRIFRGVFLKDSGRVDTEAGVDDLTGVVDISLSAQAYWFTEYRWVVPEIVTRVAVSMSGGGMGYKEDVSQPGSNAHFLRVNWIVVPGDTLIVRVGHGMPPQTDPNLHTVSKSTIARFDGSKSLNTGGVTPTEISTRLPVERSPYRSYGRGGQTSGAYGQDGFVVIEFYA